jgi:hypothetical protein
MRERGSGLFNFVRGCGSTGYHLKWTQHYRTQYANDSNNYIRFDSIGLLISLVVLPRPEPEDYPIEAVGDGRQERRKHESGEGYSGGKVIQCVSIHTRLRLTPTSLSSIFTHPEMLWKKKISRPLAVWRRLSPDGKAGVLMQIPTIISLTASVSSEISQFVKSRMAKKKTWKASPQQSPFKTYLTILIPDLNHPPPPPPPPPLTDPLL